MRTGEAKKRQPTYKPKVVLDVSGKLVCPRLLSRLKARLRHNSADYRFVYLTILPPQRLIMLQVTCKTIRLKDGQQTFHFHTLRELSSLHSHKVGPIARRFIAELFTFARQK